MFNCETLVDFDEPLDTILRMLRRTSIVVAVVVVGVGGACAGPAPAPKDLDGLGRFFFDKFDPADEDLSTSDTELADALAKLNEVKINGTVRVKDVTVDEPQKGTLGNITADEVAAVGLDAKDHPADKPQGQFIVDVIQCDLDQLEKIILNPDQLSLYPEAYATYDRKFDDGTPDFLPSWTTTYKSSENALVTNQFTATEHTALRKVPNDSATGDAGNITAFALDRVFMPKAAKFEDPGAEYTDDYQIETYFVRGDKEIVHFYAMWRYMHLGVLGDSYDSVFIDQTTGGMIDWDKKTSQLCAQ